MSERDGNVAFKCTYHDGGLVRDGFDGFEGTCSNENIRHNVLAGRSWCSHEDCECRQLFDADFRGRRPKSPCYESEIFTKWQFGSGYYSRGDRAGAAIPMTGAQRGKVALLTTRRPDHTHERDRVVFGILKIKDVGHRESQGVVVSGDRKWSLRLPADVDLKLWTFKQGEPDWRMGLFRYVSDQEVCDLLHALDRRLRSPREHMVAEHLLECCGGLPPRRRLAILDEQDDRLDRRAKYGPGGEGEQHRRLKEHVHAHPEVLRLGKCRQAHMELRFVTGDRVDVAVELADGSWCAVEVEVAGEQATLTGAHQALKYRALLAGRSDDGVAVRAALVAYQIPATVRAFCERHEVMALEVDPAAPPRQRRA